MFQLRQGVAEKKRKGKEKRRKKIILTKFKICFDLFRLMMTSIVSAIHQMLMHATAIALLCNSNKIRCATLAAVMPKSRDSAVAQEHFFSAQQ
jgi:hypothetical protein